MITKRKESASTKKKGAGPASGNTAAESERKRLTRLLKKAGAYRARLSHARAEGFGPRIFKGWLLGPANRWLGFTVRDAYLALCKIKTERARRLFIEAVRESPKGSASKASRPKASPQSNRRART